jgi:integrase
MKDNHPNIRMVKDIDSSITKEYLLAKHRFNGGTCNSNSVNVLEQGLDKISHLINRNFNLDTSWEVNHRELPQDKDPLRTLVMDREVFHQALDTMKDGSQGKTCLMISEYTGMRSSEFEKLRVSDFNFVKEELHIHESKGGRSRDISIPDVVIEIAQNWIEKKGLSGDDKMFTIKAGSICDLLQEGLKRVNHREYAEAKTSLHSVRKMVANEMYVTKIQEYLKTGMSWEKAEKTALGDVSKFLGHGIERTIKEYVNRFGSLDEFEAAGN